MPILENLSGSIRFFRVAALRLLWFANAIWFGAYRRAKSALHRVWAFIIYAHGTVMKRIIFLLALGVSSVGVALLFKPYCQFNGYMTEYVCRYTENTFVYDRTRQESHLKSWSFFSLYIFSVMALLVYLWDCLNATISFQKWNHARCAPEYRPKPRSFHLCVIGCAFLQCAFMWIIFPWKFRWILHLTQLEVAFSLLKYFLSDSESDYDAVIPFGNLKLCYLAFGTFLYCVYRNYVIASNVYRVAPWMFLADTRHRVSDSPGEGTRFLVVGTNVTIHGIFYELNERYWIRIYGTSFIPGDYSNTTWSDFLNSQPHTRSHYTFSGANVLQEYQWNQVAGGGESSHAIHPHYRLANANEDTSQEENLSSLAEGNVSGEAQADIIRQLKQHVAKLEEKLAGVTSQLEHNGENFKEVQAKFEKELSNYETLLEGYQLQSEKAQAEFRKGLSDVKIFLAQTPHALTSNNRLLSSTSATSTYIKPHEQSRPSSKASNTLNRPSSDSIPIQSVIGLRKKNRRSAQTQSSQPESTDDSSKPTSGPHALSSNSPDVNQAGKPDSCSEPPENRNSQGIPTDATMPSHSDSSPMNSERAVSKDSGSNPEPSSQIEQSHTQSETDNTNQLNSSLEKEGYKRDTVCAHSPAKATSDNASRNADSELPQSKVDNPTPVDSSPHDLLPTNPAANGTPSPRKRANFSRSAPTPASQIASPAPTTEAGGSPSMADTSTSRSPEINEENCASSVTESEPRGSQGTGSNTVPDPAHPGSLQRDEEGSKSNDSGSASEPTDQEGQPHLDPEAKNTGSSDSGCKPSVPQNSSQDPNKPSEMERSQNSAKDLDCAQPKAGIETDGSSPQSSGSTQPQLINGDTELPGEPLSSSSPKTSADPGSESRSSQGIQTNKPESLHLGSHPMDDKSSNPENSGSNPGPSKETGQSHTESETGSTNHEGDHPTQQESSVNLNDSPVEGECETNQACDQSKTENTSDKTPLFTGNGEGEPNIPTRDPTSDSLKTPKKEVPNYSRLRGYSPQRHTPLTGLSSSPMLQESQPRLIYDEKKSSSCEPPPAPNSSSTVSSQLNPTTSGSGSHSTSELRNVLNMEQETANANSDCSSDTDGSEVDSDYDQSTSEDKYKPTLEPIEEKSERSILLAPDPSSSQSHPSISAADDSPSEIISCSNPLPQSFQPQLRSDRATECDEYQPGSRYKSAESQINLENLHSEVNAGNPRPDSFGTNRPPSSTRLPSPSKNSRPSSSKNSRPPSSNSRPSSKNSIPTLRPNSNSRPRQLERIRNDTNNANLASQYGASNPQLAVQGASAAMPGPQFRQPSRGASTGSVAEDQNQPSRAGPSNIVFAIKQKTQNGKRKLCNTFSPKKRRP